jgi:hypothetical protein
MSKMPKICNALYLGCFIYFIFVYALYVKKYKKYIVYDLFGLSPREMDKIFVNLALRLYLLVRFFGL